MRKLMDEIEYQRLEDGNLLIMKKTSRRNNNQARGPILLSK
jgi:anti-sigma regulatory factor (Ser/Thr protein kinase)